MGLRWAEQYAAATEAAEAVRMAEAAAAVKEWDYGHNLTLREVAAAQRELDESQVRCVASWGVDLIHHAVICLER